ncbi:hypothetical protein SAMD00019534_072890 [Acytostelium subglobosum LB1]|uniref:hypothetical protein n=1 Tax=Acytostelium subglobosum LB1 TaxID=1410327 RepID=UPI00064521E5|nr:hypothetical protein SAMD00019534_072890 [Acytostelium subglobosum LB1]GAM24114.1 hypothetical protein SAMD00019534_072890 [Acytostelium subglobosum LB1]|eukprot:XP_012753150.1 hypothetical protein SAMD00019534_072890 [Acytostelium subglobosum LB1]
MKRVDSFSNLYRNDQQQNNNNNNNINNNNAITTIVGSPPGSNTRPLLSPRLGQQQPPQQQQHSQQHGHGNDEDESSTFMTDTGSEVIKSALIVSTETVSPEHKPYTVYRVQVETSRTIYNIIRRYSEFLDFDLKLHAAYPLSRLPFPPKKTFGKMNNEFIEQRKDHLQQFMNAILNHPTLKRLPFDPLVVSFFAQSIIDTKQLEIASPPKQSILANDQVVRYIISTLPFWSTHLDYRSLLALTETCNYLMNTVSYYSDLWYKHYWTQYNTLHYIDTRDCSCGAELKLYLQERINGLKRTDGALPNLSLINSPPPSQHIVAGAGTVHTLTSPTTSTTSTSTTKRTEPINTSPSINIQQQQQQQQQNNPSQLSSSPPTMSEAMEYSRQIFLQLLTNHYNMRTSIESHRSMRDCDCLAPKFRGTIIGTSDITGTFLKSFHTEFMSQHNASRVSSISRNPSLLSLSSVAAEQQQQQQQPDPATANQLTSFNSSSDFSLMLSSSVSSTTSTESNDNETPANAPVVSHIVSNGRMMCVSTSDSTGLSNEERRYNLSLCHFVLIAFSLIDVKSFESIGEWVEEIKLMCPEVPTILVGLKRDLRESSDLKQTISYQQGLEQSRRIANCVGYIESPSASDGIGGWRLSLLSELSSYLVVHFRNVFVQNTNKRANYTVKCSFLAKIFPKYPDELIMKGLSSYDGDVEKAMELLAVDYSNYDASNDRNKRRPMGQHNRSQSVDTKANGGHWVSPNWVADDGRPNSPPQGHTKPLKISDSQIISLVDKLKKNSVDAFIRGFLKKKSQTQEQQAEMVLSFLREMRTQLQASQMFGAHVATLDHDEEEDLITLPLNEIENYLYQNIYKAVFSTQDSLEKDVLLSDRMGKLVFVEPQHLEINEIHWNKDLWLAAQRELHSVNDLYSPSQKLEFLLSNSESPGGADDFLPHLIYVVIHANIPNLFSNFDFISKFCNTERLKMERYYYFTTFGIAVTFIENINGKHLKIDINEYDAYMTGGKKYVPRTETDKRLNDEFFEATRAKIMEKLGIDKSATTLPITSPKKKALDGSNLDDIDIMIEKRSESTSAANQSGSNPFNYSTLNDAPLLPPIQWTIPPSENKRSSVRVGFIRTPSPPDSKSLQVDEHPLALSNSSGNNTSPPPSKRSTVLPQPQQHQQHQQTVDNNNNNNRNV